MNNMNTAFDAGELSQILFLTQLGREGRKVEE